VLGGGAQGQRRDRGVGDAVRSEGFKGVGYSTGKSGLVRGWGLWLLEGLDAGLG
jgi:hypothetical protein